MRKVGELISGDPTSAEECSQEKEKELLERCKCWLVILSNLLSDRLFWFNNLLYSAQSQSVADYLLQVAYNFHLRGQKLSSQAERHY